MKESSKKITNRRDYENSSSLQLSSSPETPFLLFEKWLKEAEGKKIIDYNAMTLATVDEEGFPNVRVVLLKEYSEQKLSFFTNYDSTKGKELQHQKNVAVNFYWSSLNKQIRIKGTIEKTTRQISEKYFLSRPLGSRVAAILSPQSAILQKRYRLIGDFNQTLNNREKSNNFNTSCPEHWGGYDIIPKYFEFWLGKENRLHDRLVYDKTEDVNAENFNNHQNQDWRKYLLYP